MEHYTRTRIISEALQAWIIKDDRVPFSDFSRKMSLAHGVRKKFLENLLSDNYPQLCIKNNVLETKDE